MFVDNSDISVFTKISFRWNINKQYNLTNNRKIQKIENKIFGVKKFYSKTNYQICPYCRGFLIKICFDYI